jgi:hypothetical protein
MPKVNPGRVALPRDRRILAGGLLASRSRCPPQLLTRPHGHLDGQAKILTIRSSGAELV